MNAATIDVQQTLHGYRDGHELLASSVSLSSTARRTMLALSDLSGDGSPRSFDVYLTGYPLEDAGFYAFARTWYAEEMSRPGCVWTHTLLIPMDALGQIDDLGTLREHFRRPEIGRLPASLPVLKHSIERSSSRLVRLDGASYEIVVRLYGQSLPVLIFAESATQYEETVIEIWNQQWERLRAAFGFCTGALEPRSVEKRPLDLQVVPHQRQRRILRAADRYSVISTEDLLRSSEFAGRLREALAELSPREEKVLRMRFGIGEGPEHLLREVGDPPIDSGARTLWRDVVVQDLVHRNGALHDFVGKFSTDIEPRRTAYRDLIECWALLETLDGAATSLRDLTRTLARAFPKSSDAATLKKAVLGSESIVRGAKEADLVHELLTLPDAAAFDAKSLDLSTRAARLFRDGKRWRASSIAWLLTEESLNDAGREWANSVLSHLSVEDLTGVFSEDRELFSRLLLERPGLAKQERLWRQPRELQRAAVKVLAAITGEDLQEIITAIVEANATSVVSELVQQFGPRIVETILSGIDANRRELNALDEWQWSAQLRGNDASVVEWIDHSADADPWTLSFAVNLLGIYSNAIAKVANFAFLHHLQRADVDLTGDWWTEYAAYCFAIALRNFNGDSAALAVAAFRPVHQAALRSRISRRAWQWLGPNLPRPGWFALEDWDDGEKVRRALVEAFVRFRWSPTLLPDAVPDEQTRRWIVRYCESFANGQDLIRRAGL